MQIDKAKERKRVIVEEVSTPIEESGPLEEVKEKVTELQTITEGISESVHKSAEVQEELAEAADKVVPEAANPQTSMIGPPQPIAESHMPNPLIILIPGVLLLGAILGGVYFYQNGLSRIPVVTPTPTFTTEGTPIPSASPSGKLVLASYAIKVENGTGIPGVAAVAKDILVKAGFKVSVVGNADNYDFTDTIIEAKASIPTEFITKLTATLSVKYKVGTSKTLIETSKDNVIVIIGSSKN